MCGIHGFFTGKSNVSGASGFVSDGFVAGSLRGMDSSGIASVDTEGSDIEWQKLPLVGTYFREDKLAKKLINAATDKHQLTICHTRAATSGSVSLNNAHPFYIYAEEGETYRELVGVHNGSLDNWSSHKTAKTFNVDSEWALNHIYDEGIEAFKDIRGAYVFVFWDSDDAANLNIALNDKRNMFVAFLENGSMAYASEAGMLYWLIERNMMKVKGQLIQLTAGHWYKFPQGDMENFTKEPLPAPTAYSNLVATPNYHGHSSRSHSKSVVDNVKDLFTRIKTQLSNVSTETAAGPAVPESTKVASVTGGEVKKATEFGIRGTLGKFITSFYDADEQTLHGTFVYDGSTELDGIMRNAKEVRWTNDIALPVSAIGLIDDGREIIIVVSKPRLALALAEPLTV